MATATIRTRFIPATDTKGARIRAQGLGTSATIGYPYELSTIAAHRSVAALVASRRAYIVRDEPTDSAVRGYLFTADAPR